MTRIPDNPGYPRTVPPSRLPAMTEAEMLKEIKKLADLFGWEFYHPRWSIQSAAGWPDVTLCRPPRLIHAELKRDTGKLTPSQEHWKYLLERCTGVEYYEWRPKDLHTVCGVLR